MKIITKIIVVLSIFCFSLTATAIASEEDYDSLIVQPKQVVLRTKKIDRLCFDNLRFKKIKQDLFLVPLSSGDTQKIKKEKIRQLKESGLFDIVEPNYKLSFDQTSERNYNTIKIKNNTTVTPDIESPVVSNNSNQEITPNDKDFSSQYYLKQISATKAWNKTKGADAVLVAILDTGVQADHPDLNGKVPGDNLLNNTDVIGHGTAVAGIIAANTNNKQGIAGIAWNTKVISFKVTDDLGQARVSTVVAGLQEAAKNNVKIAQISLSTNQFSQILKNAVEEAQNKGILIISTSGNSGISELRYPAAFDGVIGVGAISKNRNIEDYSTQGGHVDLVAPGADIYSTSFGAGYSARSGTSFAAPQVSGTAALIWSVAPDLTKDEVTQILTGSSDDSGEAGRDDVFGFGILNTEKAIERAIQVSESN